jgi:hypothetical protein
VGTFNTGKYVLLGQIFNADGVLKKIAIARTNISSVRSLQRLQQRTSASQLAVDFGVFGRITSAFDPRIISSAKFSFEVERLFSELDAPGRLDS